MSDMAPIVAKRLRQVGGDALVHHVNELVSAASDGLGGRLTAASIVGSIANGDARGQASDIDLLLVTSATCRKATRRSIGERLADLAAMGPMRGLEAVLYRTDVLAAPTYPLPYELNVNGGRAMARVVSTDGTEAFWFLLDVSAARQHALAIQGPPVNTLIAPIPDELVLAALRDSLSWHSRNGGSSADVVLNACRTWHWIEHRSWLSKTAAGVWAIERRSPPPIVNAALDARQRCSDETLDPRAVLAFVEALAGRVGDA